MHGERPSVQLPDRMPQSKGSAGNDSWLSSVGALREVKPDDAETGCEQQSRPDPARFEDCDVLVGEQGGQPEAEKNPGSVAEVSSRTSAHVVPSPSEPVPGSDHSRSARVSRHPPIAAQCHGWVAPGGLVLGNGARGLCGLLSVLSPVGRAGPAGVA